MSLKFKLCACLRHGRLTGAPGTVPVEIGSREMADVAFADAERLGTFGPGELAEAKREIARSMLALKEFGIEDELRQRLLLWNLAASSTNDPDAFSRADFHDYHVLVDDFGSG